MAEPRQKQDPAPLAKFSYVLKKAENRKLLKAALTRNLDLDRFVRAAWIQTQMFPDIFDLARDKPASVFRALLQCAQMGLYPDGISGEAYLVRFKDNCVAIRGYKGLMKLFAESPVAAPMPFVCETIRDGDTWSWELGAEPKFIHKPGEKRGVITHYYAIARFKDGSIMPKVMSVEDVEKFKAYSKSKAFWDAAEENTRMWMRLKTVIRQLIKMLPLSDSTRSAVEREEAVESGSLDIEEYLQVNGVDEHISGDDVRKTEVRESDTPKVEVLPPETETKSEQLAKPKQESEQVPAGKRGQESLWE